MLAVVLFCLGFTLRARAENADGAREVSGLPSISLQELVAAARTNLPAVLSALATLKRVEAEQRVAEGAYLPRMTLEATLGAAYNRQRALPGQPLFNTSNADVTATLGFEWMALDPARPHAVEAARSALRGQRHGSRDAERLAIAAAVELYLRALAASELVRDAALTVERRTQEHKAIEELTKAGVRPSVDALRASVEVVVANYASEMKQIDEQAAFSSLSAASGGPPEQGLRPNVLPADLFVGPTGTEAISEQARKTRPELAQLREQIRAEQEAYEEASARRWPTAGVFAAGQAAYYRVWADEGTSGPQYGAQAGLFLRWNAADPILLRQRQVAAGKLSEARRKLDETTLAIRKEAVETAYQVQRSAAALEQASQVLEAASVTRKAQLERYQAGVASLLELLDAETLEQTARRSRIEADRDHQIARARVLATTGGLERLLH